MALKLGRKPTDIDYGQGEHTINCDSLGLLDEQELTDRLVRAFESPSYQPPRLPATAMELLSLSQNSDVEFDDIEALLEQDAMLAGEILSVARSVFYSGTHRVDSLRQALVRLGLSKLRQIVMQAAMNVRVFRSASYKSCMERVQRHCRATAHLSRIVSRYTPMDEEQSFMCGLLHDVGIAGILLVLGDVGRGEKSPDLAALWPAIDSAHARAGSRMVELWGLPPEIAMAVAAHHSLRIEGYDHPMAATVCLAEAIATESGFGLVPNADAGPADRDSDLAALCMHDGIDRSVPEVFARALETLGLDESMLDLIRSDARAWLEQSA